MEDNSKNTIREEEKETEILNVINEDTSEKEIHKEEESNININEIDIKESNNDNINEIDTKEEETINEEENLSALSFSSYDSVDNEKFDNMGQYTCDECGEIPKIINTDIFKKTILFKCKTHGYKEINLKNYVSKAINYNSKNWKCMECENIQNILFQINS